MLKEKIPDAAERPPSLSLLMKPASYRCNLDCAYCFYKRVGALYAGSGLMSVSTAKKVIREALALGAERNAFCWQGGEPLLMGLDFFREVVSLQEQYRQPDQVIENSIQTNGILLDAAWCGFFRENDFLVGVSLDGPGPVHDRYRVFPGGRGTFERVREGIARMQDHGVMYNILTLLTDANIQRPLEIYRFFREEGFTHLQFIQCLEKEPGSGALKPFSVRGREAGRFYVELFKLWMKDGFPHVSIRLFEDVLIYYFDRVHVSCTWMDRCNSYLVVEHNGDCYPCDFFVRPEWRLGNIVDAGLERVLHHPRRETFARMKSDVDPGCKACELLSFCHGDCTRFRRPSGGKPHGGRSEYCIALQMLLEAMTPHMPYIEARVMEFRDRERVYGGV
jgi:uncharacterized protein